MSRSKYAESLPELIDEAVIMEPEDANSSDEDLLVLENQLKQLKLEKKLLEKKLKSKKPGSQSGSGNSERKRGGTSRIERTNSDLLDFSQQRTRNLKLADQQRDDNLRYLAHVDRMASNRDLDRFSSNLDDMRQESVQNYIDYETLNDEIIERNNSLLTQLKAQNNRVKEELNKEEEKSVMIQFQRERKIKQREHERLQDLSRWNQTMLQIRQMSNEETENAKLRENQRHFQQTKRMYGAANDFANDMVEAHRTWQNDRVQAAETLAQIRAREQADIRHTASQLSISAGISAGFTKDGFAIQGGFDYKEIDYKGNVFLFIVLDKSGSMSQRSVLKGLNNFIDKQKLSKPHSNVMIIKFNDRIETMISKQEISQIIRFSNQDYIPSGCTALYDAIIDGINICRNNTTGNERIVFAIITDGEDNSSGHSKSDVKRMIEQNRNWMFTYIGVNSSEWSGYFGFDKNMCFTFDSNFQENNFEYLNHIMNKIDELFKVLNQSFYNSVNNNYLALNY